MWSRLDRLLSVSEEVIAVGTFGVMLLLFVLGRWELAMVSMVVGWFLLLPLVSVVGNEVEDIAESAHPSGAPTETSGAPAETSGAPTETSGAPTEPGNGPTATDDDPVQTLRERYTSGEIDEIEFERRLETLLATEDADESETERERNEW